MDDYAFALQLQEQLEQEDIDAVTVIEPVVERPLGIVDGRWEMIDPTPDIRVLFQEFDKEFFWQRLAGVEVRWSPRMTSCAGLCVYEGKGGLCSVRLSQPLLKLRPRSDLIETLLHEMIHAYLFVTNNDRDHDGHGPEFLKHMHRINSATGAHLSVYHNFHDEVASHRQHWWRCDGRCQNRPPYFGYVKRAMNRAPSHNDRWYGDHMLSCGGSFHKIKEPPGYENKKDKEPKGKSLANKLPKGRDIRQALQRSNKQPASTHTHSSSETDSCLFPHTGYRLGGGPATGNKQNNTHTFPHPSCSTDTRHTTPATVIALDTSSGSDTDPDLAERMRLKHWSVSSGMLGHHNGKRRYVSSSDTDSDRHELHHLSSITSHKKVKSETGTTRDASCSQGQGHDRNANETEVVSIDINTCSGDTRVECPNCAVSVTTSSINQHLDECLT